MSDEKLAECQHPINQIRVTPLPPASPIGGPATHEQWSLDHHPDGRPRFRTIRECLACGRRLP